MNLADYERRKFELGDVLRRLADLRGAPPGLDDSVQALKATLAEDRFNLVVVGRFSRGKSTLMNALLGVDRLPTGVVPLTSVITAVGYGSQDLIRVTFEGRIMKEDVSLSDLRNYVTQEGNPGNRRRVKLAEIQLPVELLRRGFYFIDTPGLGSAVVENSRTTQAFLPSADAVVLVTGFDGPLSAEELDVLEQVRATGRPLFVVMNKQDSASPPDRDAALAYVAARLADLGLAATEVFSTSAQDGLAARLGGGDALWSSSGMAALEAALIRFLTAEKNAAFLTSLCDRTWALASASPGAPADLFQALRTIRARAADPSSSNDAAIGGLQPVRSEQAQACGICTAIERGCFDFLAQYQYALTVDPEVRGSFTEGHGFCAMHTWRYNSITSPHGVCLSYPDLADQLATALSGLSRKEAPGAELADALQTFLGSEAHCPACGVSQDVERAAATAITKRLDAGGDVAEESALCLSHLGQVLSGLRDPATAHRLLAREAALFERIGEDMRRYAIKFEAIRQTLASRAEEQAPRRMLRLTSGSPNLSFVQRQD